MIIRRVKIISSKMPDYWYSKHIGEEFFVTDHIALNWNRCYKVAPGGVDGDYGMCYIEKSDVEIIDVFQGEIVTEIRVVRTGEMEGEQ